MSHPPIIDAGPGLNFFSINKERLLIGVLGRISAPETVQTWARPWPSRTQSSPRKPGRPSRFSSTTAPEPAQQQLKSAACNDSSPVVAP